MSLATKYRPQSFEEVCGQNITVTILKKVILEKAFKNVYLFSGNSGCGKTTCARIFAKAINNGIGDPIEIDAASNSGVDNVRSIIESANQRSLVGEYKIYIIDECHSLTSQAWQAFLKGIEETPKYTIFIFCTTEPQKIPATILNRVQRYNFAPISQAEIKNRLVYICRQEGFINYEDSCEFISKMSNNSMREAITYLEQIADYSKDLNIEVAKKVFGSISYETMFKLTWAIQKNESSNIINIIENLFNEGQDLKNFINTYLSFILDLAKFSIFRDINLTSIPSYLASENNAVVQFTVNSSNTEYFTNLASKILEIKSNIRYDLNYKSTIIVMLLSIAKN
jgi:DNA polymerase-3 subunit gamma/tau